VSDGVWKIIRIDGTEEIIDKETLEFIYDEYGQCAEIRFPPGLYLSNGDQIRVTNKVST
jgi:hypothetical protein